MTDMNEPFKSSRSTMLCLCCWFFPKPQFDTFSISAHSPPEPMPMYLALGTGCSLEILPATSSCFIFFLFRDNWTLGLRDEGVLTKE